MARARPAGAAQQSAGSPASRRSDRRQPGHRPQSGGLEDDRARPSRLAAWAYTRRRWHGHRGRPWRRGQPAVGQPRGLSPVAQARRQLRALHPPRCRCVAAGSARRRRRTGRRAALPGPDRLAGTGQGAGCRPARCADHRCRRRRGHAPRAAGGGARLARVGHGGATSPWPAECHGCERQLRLSRQPMARGPAGRPRRTPPVRPFRHRERRARTQPGAAARLQRPPGVHPGPPGAGPAAGLRHGAVVPRSGAGQHA